LEVQNLKPSPKSVRLSALGGAGEMFLSLPALIPTGINVVLAPTTSALLLAPVGLVSTAGLQTHAQQKKGDGYSWRFAQ